MKHTRLLLPALLVLTAMTISAAPPNKDAPKLPPKAQAARDKYDPEIVKAKEEYQKRLEAALKKYLAALEEAKKVAIKAGDLDGAQAITAEIDDALGTSPSKAPDDAKRFGRHFYVLYPERMSWADANAFCKKVGGRLATPLDQGSAKFVGSMVNEGDAWIGGMLDGKRWAWAGGRTIYYSNWYPHEPNNEGGVEDRIATNTTGWIDAAQQLKKPFICEW